MDVGWLQALCLVPVRFVGTRFITAKESGANKNIREGVYTAGFDSTIKSTIWTGRPLRNLKTPYIENWEKNRQTELLALQAKGTLALEHELDYLAKTGQLTEEIEDQSTMRPLGQVAALVNKRDQTAKEIVEEMVEEARRLLAGAGSFVSSTAKL